MKSNQVSGAMFPSNAHSPSKPQLGTWIHFLPPFPHDRQLWAPRQCWLAVWFSRCIAPRKDWREYCHTGDGCGTNRKTGKRGFSLLSGKKSSLFWEWWISLIGTGKCWSLSRLAVYAVSQGEGVEKTKEALWQSLCPSQPLAAWAPRWKSTGIDEAERNAKGPTTLLHQTVTKISPNWNNFVKFFPLALANKLGLAQNNLRDDIVQKMSLSALYKGWSFCDQALPDTCFDQAVPKPSLEQTQTQPLSLINELFSGRFQPTYLWKLCQWKQSWHYSMETTQDLHGSPIIFWPCFATSP